MSLSVRSRTRWLSLLVLVSILSSFVPAATLAAPSTPEPSSVQVQHPSAPLPQAAPLPPRPTGAGNTYLPDSTAEDVADRVEEEHTVTGFFDGTFDGQESRVTASLDPVTIHTSSQDVASHVVQLAPDFHRQIDFDVAFAASTPSSFDYIKVQTVQIITGRATTVTTELRRGNIVAYPAAHIRASLSYVDPTQPLALRFICGSSTRKPITCTITAIRLLHDLPGLIWNLTKTGQHPTAQPGRFGNIAPDCATNVPTDAPPPPIPSFDGTPFLCLNQQGSSDSTNSHVYSAWLRLPRFTATKQLTASFQFASVHMDENPLTNPTLFTVHLVGPSTHLLVERNLSATPHGSVMP